MEKKEKFNCGDLVYYKKSVRGGENKFCLILDEIHPARNFIAGKDSLRYFNCLLNNNIEIIYELWLEKL